MVKRSRDDTQLVTLKRRMKGKKRDNNAVNKFYRSRPVFGGRYFPRVSLSKGPLPATMPVRMVFGDTNNSTASAAFTEFKYKANGLQDPRHDTGGGQPRGYDQLMSMYNHYTVTGSTITVTWSFDHDSGGQGTRIYYLGTMASSETVNNVQDAVESPNTVYRVISGIDDTSNGQIPTITLKRKVNIAQYLGVKDILSFTNAKAQIGSNPVEEVRFQCGFGNLAGVGSGLTTYITVKIVYDMILSEPKFVAAS